MAFGITADFDNTEDKGFDTIEPTNEKPTNEKPAKQKPSTEVPEPDITSMMNKGPQHDQVFDVLEKAEPKENPKEDLKEPTLELDDEKVTEYLKNKYFKDKEFSGLDSLITPKEPQVKTVNPYEDLMDEQDKAYFNYKKETGRSRKEFEFLNQDISKLSEVNLAIDKVKQDTGLSLSKEDAIEYLERKLDIDLSSEELSVTDKIELNAFVKPYRETLIEQQQKYKAPLENTQNSKSLGQQTVILPDGREVNKNDAQQIIEQDKQKYIENIQKGVNSVTASKFSIEFDNDGEKQTVDFNYEYSKEDKQRMLSDARDVDEMIARRYSTEDGFNHSKLAQGFWWGDEKNQQKVIAAAMQQARAQVLAEQSARDNNEVFSRKPIKKTETDNDGYGSLEEGISQTRGGFGVKYNV